MNSWLVDTNVLIDVIGGDAVFGEACRDALERCTIESRLVINPVVYAEVGAFMDYFKGGQVATGVGGSRSR